MAGEPGTNRQAKDNSKDSVEEQPPGVADGFLQVMASFQPFPENFGQIFRPPGVHTVPDERWEET